MLQQESPQEPRQHARPHSSYAHALPERRHRQHGHRRAEPSAQGQVDLEEHVLRPLYLDLGGEGAGKAAG